MNADPKYSITRIDEDNWASSIELHPDTTPFHTTWWIRTLVKSYRFIPHYLRIDSGGSIRILIPLLEVKLLFLRPKGVVLPFTDFCPPLFFDPSFRGEDFLRCLELYKAKMGWKNIELRGGCYSGKTADSSFVHHYLDLRKDRETLYSGLKSHNKRNIVKSGNSGITISEEYSLSAIREFHRLQCKTRKRHGLPPQPFYFFRNIGRYVMKEKHGRILFASHGNRKIAALLFITHKSRVIYKYGASDFHYQNLRANDLLMWDAINRFKNEGFTQLSFGRTEPGNKGLIAYKDSWGTESEVLNYYSIGGTARKLSDGKNGLTRIMKRLPTPILRIIGFIFYRFIG